MNFLGFKQHVLTNENVPFESKKRYF